MNIKAPSQSAAVAGAIVTVLILLLLLLILDEWLLSRPAVEVNSTNDVQAEHIETGKAMERFNQWVLIENRRIFEWHARSTKILFWTSILITVTGMVFAFWQFVEASQSEQKALDAAEFEMKSQLISLAFKSRSLATFMMFVSIAYLLIYVTLVYPVRPVNNESVAPISALTDVDDPGGSPDEQDKSSPDRPNQDGGVKPQSEDK